MAQFTLDVNPPETAVISAVGDIDMEAASKFRRVLADAAESGSKLILVDMARVDFLDSAGLAVLVGARRQLPLTQELALCNVPPRMSRALEIAGTGRIMTIHLAGQQWPWPQVREPQAPAS
jgi:anti-anti-sigma factor